MAGATEELWFPQWEFKGMPWDNPGHVCEMVAQFFREGFQNADAGVSRRDWITGFPSDRAMQLFTALQMEKVPSKLVLFPDEGHWVTEAAEQRAVV